MIRRAWVFLTPVERCATAAVIVGWATALGWWLL